MENMSEGSGNMVIAASTVIVVSEVNEILLIRHPVRGWEMPQGRVEEGESFRAAAIREVREETGIEIELTAFCGVFHNVDRGVCNLLFLGNPIGGRLTTSIESLEVGFFPLEKVTQMVKWSNFLERIHLAIDENSHPFLVEFMENGSKQ
jgi:8-oxo-dGTP pyrophosphatase MutT (NUDIX family)